MAKFKIGQKVKFIGDPLGTTILHILERQEITCSAGTQVFYSGRLWVEKQYNSPKNACGRELWKANEIELMAIKKS